MLLPILSIEDCKFSIFSHEYLKCYVIKLKVVVHRIRKLKMNSEYQAKSFLKQPPSLEDSSSSRHNRIENRAIHSKSQAQVRNPDAKDGEIIKLKHVNAKLRK